MKGSGCARCPANEWGCDAQYRGSRCAALRAAKDLGDPITKSDYIKYLDDEELAKFFVDNGWDCKNCSEDERLSDNPLLRGEKCDEECEKHCLEWLQSPMDK